jgi:hypothetical protein
MFVGSLVGWLSFAFKLLWTLCMNVCVYVVRTVAAVMLLGILDGMSSVMFVGYHLLLRGFGL